MFKIGHSAYSGANRVEFTRSAHLAVMTLVKRGVEPTTARHKVNEAASYPHPHVTMTTKDNLHVIELIHFGD